MDEKVAAERS